jgi:hypothetical protein
MKKSVLFLAFIAFLLNQATAQCVSNGITTNPAAPINNELPSKRNIYFDWTQQFFQNNSTCQLNINVESPFYKIDNLEALRVAKDMMPIDGWELIRRDLGYYDDNTLRPDAPQHTYFILYNKYTGILRILLKACRGADYNGMKITFRFDATSSWQTALLNLTDGQIEGLNTTHTANPAAQSVATFINDDTKWFYADFPMAYDPCTCQYASKLNIITNLIQSSAINLEGTITGQITSITNGKGTVANDGKYGFRDFVNGTEKFQKTYNSVDGFITQTKIVTDAIFGAGSDQSNAVSSFETALKSSSFLKTGLGAVPWLKSAVSVLDIFIGGGKSAVPQPVQLMPLAVNLGLKLNGSITTSNQYHNITFTNPGSLNAKNDPSIYPTYNEVLGVFTLLNNPTFIDDWANSTSGMFVTGATHILRLKEPIKWTLNPSSRLQLQDAQVAYVASPQVPTIAGEPTTLPENFAVNNINVAEGKDAITGNFTYRTEYTSLSCLGNNHNFKFSWSGLKPGVPKMYLKFMLNFKKLDDPNGQNVLLVLTYPIAVEGRLMTTATNRTHYPYNYNTCVGGLITEATANDLTTFCTSTNYKTNRQMRLSDSARNNGASVTDAGYSSIKIFPVPAADNLNVSAKDNILRVVISNTAGQILYSRTYAGAAHVLINTGNFIDGTYIVKVVTTKASVSQKIIISKK